MKNAAWVLMCFIIGVLGALAVDARWRAEEAELREREQRSEEYWNRKFIERLRNWDRKRIHPGGFA